MGSLHIALDIAKILFKKSIHLNVELNVYLALVWKRYEEGSFTSLFTIIKKGCITLLNFECQICKNIWKNSKYLKTLSGEKSIPKSQNTIAFLVRK